MAGIAGEGARNALEKMDAGIAGFVAGIDKERFSSCAGIAEGGAGMVTRPVLWVWLQVLRGISDVEGPREFCMGIALFFAIPATKLAICNCCERDEYLLSSGLNLEKVVFVI